MGHLDLNREMESIQHQVWCLVSFMEEEINLSPWGEKGDRGEPVYKLGEGHRNSRQHLGPRSHWLQNEGERSTKETQAPCQERPEKTGRLQAMHRTTRDRPQSNLFFPGDEEHRLLLRAVWKRQRAK